MIPGDHNPQASRSYEGNMNAQEFGIDNHVFMFRARIHLDSLLVSVVHCPYFTNSDLPPWQSGSLFIGHFGDVSFLEIWLDMGQVTVITDCLEV